MGDSERVDKSWATAGLGKYSTPAILGTLRHYGVSVDEQALGLLTSDKYPVELAALWDGAWKGKGQFSRFHWAAAEELWRRSQPEKLAPHDFAKVVMELMDALRKLLNGAPDAPVGRAFQAVDVQRAKIPVTEGKPDEKFVNEFALWMGEGMKVFTKLSDQLAKEGHLDDANQFADLEEFLFPEWRGISKALVRATEGETQRAEAIAALEGIGKDAARSSVGRMGAVDGLLSLGAYANARALAQPMFDEVKKTDLHAAMELGQRIAYALERMGDKVAMRMFDEDLHALHQQHAREHHH